MRKSFIHPIACIVVLTAAVFLCFGRTLGSYFLADDFGEVAYVARIFEGDLGRLWSNFTGNYMQVPSMAVYRPWLLMTLLFDYSLWKTSAFGYYLTNLLHYLACTVLIFTLISLLTNYWGRLRSFSAATFAALIFALHPLHCESVSWVVGRVDIVCLAYYLLGLVSVAMYVRQREKKWIILTVVSFWLSILTKEMAIAMPVTATLIAFLWGYSEPFSGSALATRRSRRGAGAPALRDPLSTPGSMLGDGASGSVSPADPQPGFEPTLPSIDRSAPATATVAKEAAPIVAKLSLNEFVNESAPTLKDRVSFALPVAIALGASTVVYFIIRYLALGTITGGYTAGIGASQFDGIVQKWTDVDTVMRIVFPLNQSVFGEGSTQRLLLGGIYLALTSLATARLIVGAVPRRWLVFLVASGLTALAPIYQLWGIGYDLEGSRFTFFLTVPLAMLLPILLFAPLEHGTPTQPRRATNKLMIASVVALAALTFVFGKITMRNNIPWVHAGKQTHAITDKAQNLSRSIPQGKLACLVGIPKDEGGAHMILNGTTFHNTITPPFAPKGLTGKLVTFEPVIFGNPDKIDTRHFKEALHKPNVTAFYRWDMEKKDFVPFNPGAPLAIPQTLHVSLVNLTPEKANSQEGKQSIAFFPYTESRGEVVSGTDGRTVDNAIAGLGIKISGLKLQPAQFDFLAARLRINDRSCLQGKSYKLGLVSATGEKTSFDCTLTPDHVSTISESANAETLLVRFPLSCFWKYYAFGEIETVTIELPSLERLSVDSIEFLPYSMVAPSVEIVNRKSTNDGAFLVDNRTASRMSKQPVQLVVDGKCFAETNHIDLQVLKKNFFFDNLTSEKAVAKGVETTLRKDGKDAQFVIPEQLLQSTGYIQVRSRCFDDRGRQVGENSMPLTLRVLAD